MNSCLFGADMRKLWEHENCRNPENVSLFKYRLWISRHYCFLSSLPRIQLVFEPRPSFSPRFFFDICRETVENEHLTALFSLWRLNESRWCAFMPYYCVASCNSTDPTWYRFCVQDYNVWTILEHDGIFFQWSGDLSCRRTIYIISSLVLSSLTLGLHALSSAAPEFRTVFFLYSMVLTIVRSSVLRYTEGSGSEKTFAQLFVHWS